MEDEIRYKKGMTIRDVGRSLSISLTEPLRMLGLSTGDRVSVEVRDSKIVIRGEG